MFYIIISYFIGTILFASIIGKLKKVDLQQQNSGNLGARNAGRTLGKWAFVVVAVGDGLKGFLVVLAGQWLHYSAQMIAFAVIAVVLGHLFPFWNRLRGGKGVATVIGAMLVFAPLYFLVFLASFVVSLLVTKSATLGMTIGFIIYGIVISLMLPAGIIFTIPLLFVIYMLRDSIQERVKPNVLE